MKNQLNKAKRYYRFFLWLLVVAAVCYSDVSFPAQSGGGITAKDQKAKELLDAALKALGGADKIDGIKSLVLKGNLVGTIVDYFETWILLPDSFLHLQGNEIPAPGRKWQLWEGIVQGAFLPNMVFSSSEGGITNEPAEENIPRFTAGINAEKDIMSYFLIGILAKSGPTSLVISSGSTPGVFSLTKNDGKSGEIEFDSKTGYPSVVRFKTYSANGEVRQNIEMQFRDRFLVNGIMFPRTINISTYYGTSGSIMTHQRLIDEVQINPNLSLKDFEVYKQYNPALATSSSDGSIPAKVKFPWTR